MKRVVGWLLLLLLSSSPIRADDAIRLDEAAQIRTGVVTEPVAQHSFADRMRVVGKVVRSPGTTVTVETSLTGRVQEVLVAPGDSVTANQPLLTLRSHELYSREADLLRLHEKKQYLEDRYRAGQELYGLEGISRMELNMRRRESFDTGIEYEQARHQLEELGHTQREVDRILARKEPEGLLTVRSPDDGVVLELDVQKYDWVKTFRPLVMLGDPKKLELEFEIPPAESSRVDMGDRVEFTSAGEQETIGTALVLTPIPKVDPETRTVTVRAEILSSPGTLLPGLFIEGILTHGHERRAPSVPEEAVIRIGDQDHVFVRKGPEDFEPRPVRLGQFDGERYEVLSGVRVGEPVVAQGVFFLKSALLKGDGEDE